MVFVACFIFQIDENFKAEVEQKISNYACTQRQHQIADVKST